MFTFIWLHKVHLPPGNQCHFVFWLNPVHKCTSITIHWHQFDDRTGSPYYHNDRTGNPYYQTNCSWPRRMNTAPLTFLFFFFFSFLFFNLARSTVVLPNEHLLIRGWGWGERENAYFSNQNTFNKTNCLYRQAKTRILCKADGQTDEFSLTTRTRHKTVKMFVTIKANNQKKAV